MCYAGFRSVDKGPVQGPQGLTWATPFQGIYVTRVSEGGPAEIAGLQIGDKIMQVTRVPKEEKQGLGQQV